MPLDSQVYCHGRRKWCRVTNHTKAPISWPHGQPLGQRGGVGLVVTPELRDAVKKESAAALCYWFGVTEGVVWRWRKRFKIGRIGTEGSKSLHAETCAKGAAWIKAKERTEAELDRRAELSRRLGLKPPATRWKVREWTDAQRALLGTEDDEVIAAKIGRTAEAVRNERERRKIPRFRDRRRTR